VKSFDFEFFNRLLGVIEKRITGERVSICQSCCGDARVIACIEDQAIVDKILKYLLAKRILPHPSELLPATQVSPNQDWLA
jgi:hypothetical protein